MKLVLHDHRDAIMLVVHLLSEGVPFSVQAGVVGDPFVFNLDEESAERARAMEKYMSGEKEWL